MQHHSHCLCFPPCCAHQLHLWEGGRWMLPSLHHFGPSASPQTHQEHGAQLGDVKGAMGMPIPHPHYSHWSAASLGFEAMGMAHLQTAEIIHKTGGTCTVLTSKKYHNHTTSRTTSHYLPTFFSTLHAFEYFHSNGKWCFVLPVSKQLSFLISLHKSWKHYSTFHYSSCLEALEIRYFDFTILGLQTRHWKKKRAMQQTFSKELLWSENYL